MSITIYNTLTDRKEELVPLKKGRIGLYVCGLTVYDSSHIGHARAALTYDMVVRYLRYAGYKVDFVRNYTDVDDKIIARANKERVSAEEIAERYIKEDEREMAALGVVADIRKPKATEHIDGMIELIETLTKKKAAYAVNGDVYFSVRAFKGYGKLSRRNIEELESGARIEVDEKKRDPLDFALWKKAKPGEPSWKSPWGEGRPGWHIECSVMSTKFLGQPFDIHGGGRDLVFPHHENEIAQSEAACGKQFAKYWMHNGLISMQSEKMSKSLGNIATMKSILERYHPEVVRLFLFSNHYRSPISYSDKGLEETKTSLDRFYETTARVMSREGEIDPSKELLTKVTSFETEFQRGMNDDFNTAVVTGIVFDIVRSVNRELDSKKKQTGSSKLRDPFAKMQVILQRILGCFGSDPYIYQSTCAALSASTSGVDTAEIERLIAERVQAREEKNFKRSDEIREQLAEMGVELKDRPDGSTEWKVK